MVRDLYYLAESFRLGSTDYKDFLHTTFAWFDEDDHGYFGQIQIPKLQATLDDIAGALELISDEEVFPPLQQAMLPLSTAPDNLNFPAANELKDFYIKRPPIHQYDWYKEEDCLYIIPASFLEEATALVSIARHQQHPNIIKFLGCRLVNDVIFMD
ncbi:serine/threonine kinase [Colletotrichum graminicola]|nr:serine/threonine kinase [Colletotrichum graminicola]